MDYSLKNARNGKSISKNSKMNKFEALGIQEDVYTTVFKLLENLENFYGKWRAMSCSLTIFLHPNLLIFLNSNSNKS